VLVQAMAPGGLECLVGASTEPVFGPVVAFGIGGVTTELVGDVAFRLPPLTDSDAQEMLDEIRSAPLLHGFRGTAAVDQTALQDVVLRVSQLVDDVAMIAEADLNPVVAYPAGHGVTVLDGRIRVRRAVT